MDLERLYKEVSATNHASALQAIYDAGFADGVKGMLEATTATVDPLTDSPTVTDVVTLPTPTEVPANDTTTPSP